MRIKEDQLVLTFPSTMDAMSAEMILQASDIPGRLIPTPVALSAECGLAWKSDPDQKEAILEALEGQVKISRIEHVALY